MSGERQLRTLLARYDIAAESLCGRSFLTFLALLEKWNDRVNLVSSSSWEILGPLFEEGIWAGRLYPQGPLKHLDIGSGGGFPAIPLCLLNPEMRMSMVERSTKRFVFLETVCQTLSLDRARVYHGTLDALLRSSVEEEAWDCTSWKALRLKRKEFALLIRKTAVNAAFWIFQGNDIPLEGGLPGSSLELECSHKVPGKPAWQLSIYRKMPEPHCFT